MKEMMKQKMMNRFHKRNSSTSSSVDFKSGEKLDFKFSSLQALQVPAGWDKLTLSLISIETDKTVTKTGKASVFSGNCRWTETLSESIWISDDDSSKELQPCLYKLLISKGSTRSSILGEVTVNLANYLSSETSLPIALPLKKCDYGTILQVAIQCLNPRPNLRWQDNNSVPEEVNSEYSDLENTSDVPNGTNFSNVGSSSMNSIPDTSHAKGLHSRDTSLSTVRSYHSFDSSDSFGRESSVSNHSEVAVDLNGKPESNNLVNVYDSPRSNRSGKNLLNQRQDSGKSSHIPASPLRSFNASDYVLETEGSTPEEIRAEARSWERNARKLKVDLNLSRSETINQTKNLENVTMELSALQKECKGLKDEIKHLKILLDESAVKERDADSLKIQVQNKIDIQAELEESLRFQKDLNEDLSLQLNKTQESNLELVSVLQELEETIEKQRLEIKSLESSSERPSNDTWKIEVELQKFQESQKRMENTIFHLEKTLEEKSQTLLDYETEWRQKLSLKDEEINNLKAKLSEAVDVPVVMETESWTIEETHDLDDEVKALKEKVLELERDCNELTDENLDLLFKIKESNSDLLTDGSFIKYSAQLSDLKKENSQLEESLKAMQQELEVTKDSYVSGNKILETKLRESEDNFLKLLKISEDLEGKLSSMTDEIESKENMFDSEIDDLHLKFKENVENKLNQMYSDKVVEVENLKQELEQLNLQISATDDERDRMASEEKDKMVNSIAEVEEKLRLSEKKVETIQVEYEKKISDLTAEITAFKQNHENLTELLENTRSSEEKLKNTVDDLSVDIKSCEDKIVQFTEDNSSLKNSLNDMKYENERLSASLQVISDDYQQLKEENTSLIQKAANMQKSVIELEDHKTVMEEKLLRLEGDLTAREEALGAQDAELKNEVEVLKRSNSQLQLEVNRLQEEKDEYLKKLQHFEEQKQQHEAISIGSDSLHEEMKLKEDVEVNTVDSRIQSLETALAEALEANENYKLQLKSFMSPPVRESVIPVKFEVSNEELKKEHKNIVSSLEKELNELQERYLNMSLKYAEVEAQREELVLKLKGNGPGRSWFS